jgi:hypothetical protein
MSTIINATTTNGVVIQPDNSGSLVLQTNSGTTALTIDTSQRAAFVAGTAALPAITTTGDTNTGMWFPAADTIAFSEGGTEVMRLGSSGNVGIGTTGVDAGEGKLNIASSTSPVSLHLFYGTNGDNYLTCGSSGIQVFRTGSTERMRIDSSGYTLIGTTSQLGGANNQLNIKAADIANTAYGLAIQNAAASTGGRFINFVNSSNTTNGFVSQTNSTTVAYTTSSDYRLKENIKPLQNALDRVSLLKPVAFKWKESNDIGEGFIAHELAEIIPDAVCGNKDDIDNNGNPKYQGVDTSFLVATLTAAIQEQQTIINDLKARIESLEAK